MAARRRADRGKPVNGLRGPSPAAPVVKPLSQDEITAIVNAAATERDKLAVTMATATNPDGSRAYDVAEIARTFSVSTATIYRSLRSR